MADKGQKPFQKQKDGDKQTVGAAKMIRRKRVRGPKQVPLSYVVSNGGGSGHNRPSLFLFTLYFLYKNLYILGISIVRRCLRSRRRARRGLLILKGSSYALLHRIALFAVRVSHNVSLRVKTSFRRIRDVYRQQLPAIQAAQRKGTSPIEPLLPVLEQVGKLALKIITTVLNHTVPIAAAVLLMVVVNTWLQRPVFLKLVYNGEELGYIENESVFDEASQQVRERTINQNIQGVFIGTPTLSLEEVTLRDLFTRGGETPVQTEDLLQSGDLANMLIERSGSEIETAYGLFVDDRLIGAVTDKDAILDELARIKAENATGKTGERVEFLKRIRFPPALYLAETIVDADELIAKMRANETESETYTVQEGDTPSEIAEKNGMRYAELLRLNPDIETDLMPGMELQTKVARPFLSVKNIYTDTYEEEVPYETVEVENATYAIGYRNLIQEGVNGLRRVIAEITAVNGQEVGRTILDDSEIIKNPVAERVVVGITDPKTITSTAKASTDMTPSGSASSAGFIWPTRGGVATTYRNHTGNGIDIAPGGSGNPIYASAAGVVSNVVNGYTGYGHYIVIDHGNGYQTLYAHNSANLVSVGERVEQGQVIASMGRTGWATGPHVHFEIRYNGRYMNPTNYVGYSG